LDKVRQRKLEARAHRQEALHPTPEKTIIQVPQPRNLVTNFPIVADKIKETNKLPKVAEIVKRGRGRPPKAVSEKIDKKKKVISGNKKLASTKGKK
jgi:hypothetical protein